MKIVTKTMAILMLSSIVLGQSLFDQYDVPEFEYSTFQVSGDDLFYLKSFGDTSTTKINLGANYMSKFQSPGYNLSYGVNFDYDSWSYSTGTDSTTNDAANWDLDVPFGVDKYFGGPKGAFVFADGAFATWGGDAYKDACGNEYDTADCSDLYLNMGAGYGRVVDAKPIAQAYAIADAINGDKSDDTILAIASVLGKGMSYYEQEYKDDAEQEYYNALAKAAGSPNSAMTIMKVLKSRAYNISDRYAGWMVKAGHTNNYMQGDIPDSIGTDAGYMVVRAEYAMPMDVNAQLTASLSMYTDLNECGDDCVAPVPDPDGSEDGDDGGDWDDDEDGDDGGGEEGGDDANAWDAPAHERNYTFESHYADRTAASNMMEMELTYKLNHSYNWLTEASFKYASNTPGWKDANTTTTTTLEVKTTKAVLSKMSITGEFTYTMTALGVDGQDDPDPVMEIKTNIAYWVF